MKTNMKRFLGILLSLALVLGLLPGMMTAVASEVIQYPIWVGGKQVDSENMTNVFGDGKVSYTPATGTTPATLTLDGYNNNNAVYHEGETYAAIYATQNLIIHLKNDNTLENNNSGGPSDAILVNGGNLTVNGTGTLHAVGNTVGIQATGDIFINGGTVDSTATRQGIFSNNGSITITGGNITASSSGSGYGRIGIWATQTVTITGGNVTAKGAEQAIAGNVKNSVAGVGWTDKEGTLNRADIAVSSTGRALNYKNVRFPVYVVTYKVVGGTWSDDTTADKTENVLPESIPASVPTGMKVSEGYTGDGAWDTNPTGATITEAKTFTYSFTKIPAAEVVTAPTAKDLTYTGSAQALVTAGTASGGTMQYALGTDDKTAPTEGWSSSIPAKTEAGTYYVWYRVKGDLNHYDSEPRCVTVNITNAPPAPTAAPTAAPTHVPKTGDGANLVLWIGLILLGFLGIIAFAGMAGRKHRNR